MSWILGFISESISDTRRQQLGSLHASDPLVDTPSLYVAANGPQETLKTSLTHAATEGWVITGVPLRYEGNQVTRLTATDLAPLLSSENVEVSTLQGHFVAVRWRDRVVECYTDPLGLRGLYACPCADGIAFSTRMDWIAQLLGQADLNLEAFGAHWLTFNQLSTDALLHGVSRTGPGGRARFTPTSVTLSHQPWSPAFQAPTTRSFTETIRPFLSCSKDSEQPVSLGLSGGLDSRYLLSLLTQGDQAFQTHVFGSPDHPDVRLSCTIAEHLHLPYQHHHAPIPETDALLASMKEHMGQTAAVSPASAVLGLRYYPLLHRDGFFMLDGGFGEIARRQFMNRLLRKHRTALFKEDLTAILPSLRFHRTDVFTDDINRQMERGALLQLEQTWQEMPALQQIGAANFLDLFAIRTRLPNFYAQEQSRLDGQIGNIMPFAQPAVLQAVFQTPVRLRKNGRLFRKTIRSQSPDLVRFPLVKGNRTYPFILPTLPALAWTKAMAFIKPAPPSPSRSAFLEVLQPFALDTLHSSSVRTDPMYDLSKLDELVAGFYARRHHRAAEMDWWLSFEMWRQSLNP